MADAGLWLPPHFDALINPRSGHFCFPSEFPYDFGLSSPAVESVAGSTETESSDGEGDFFAGLTRRLSQTSLHETRKQLSALPNNPDSFSFSEVPCKTHTLVGSPQSTLTGIGSWSGRSAVSGEGSPNGYSRVPSPSTTPFHENNDPLEVIYAAAGQVARFKLNNNQAEHFDFQNSRGLLTHHRSNLQSGSVWGRSNCLVPQGQGQCRAREFGRESVNVKCTRPWSIPQSACPSLQQNNRVQIGRSGSLVRVPAGGGSSLKRGYGGTGVFLPRHYETPSEPRNKTGCAPVLLPAKVVHALNLNIDDLSKQRFSNAFTVDYDAILARRKALLMQQQRLSLRREEAANYEIRLPQEWTY